MFIRAYLRASTQEQDATRAREELHKFAADRGWKIATTYVENVSGATLKRPELFRLLSDSQPGDVLLVEQIDRLSRLNAADWEKLRREMDQRELLVVSLDLPTSWAVLEMKHDEVMHRIFKAMNNMMLDTMAAYARKDYDDRRRRQIQGIAKAVEAGSYRGRRENAARNAVIMKMLASGHSWSEVVTATRASMRHVSRLAKRMKEGAKA